MNKARAGWLVIAVAACAAEPAWSCSCVAYPDDAAAAVTAAWRDADLVFVGEVTGSGVLEGEPGLELVEVSFTVARQWKGASAEPLTVRTARSPASCGFKFHERRSYLVFAYADRSFGGYQTGICSLTTRIERAGKYLQILDELASPHGRQDAQAPEGSRRNCETVPDSTNGASVDE